MKKTIVTSVIGVMLLVCSIFFVSNYTRDIPPQAPTAVVESEPRVFTSNYPPNPQPRIMSATRTSNMTIRAKVVDEDDEMSLLERNNDGMLIVETELEVKIGQLVIIDVTQSSGNVYKWSVMPETENFRVFDEGRVAVFSSGVPGDYTFFVSCCASDELDHKIIVIRVLNKYPNPGPPGPNPPNPEPVDPNAPIDVKIAYWLDGMSANKGDCARLGQSFDSVAAQIKAGVIPVAKIAAATKESSRTALGHRADVWTPFMENLQAEIVARSKAGTLKTAEQHEKLWRQIGAALKKYAGPSNVRDIIKAGEMPAMEKEAAAK